MAFGLLMPDNTPVPAPFRRSARAAEQAIALGRFSRRRVPGFAGFVDESGYEHEDESSPLPGTAPVQESSNWQSTVAGVLNLGTSIVNAVAGAIQPHSGPAGQYCPSGYYMSNGRCVPAQSNSGSMTPLLIGGGLLAAVLFLRK